MNRESSFPNLTRRHLLKGTAAAAVASLLPWQRAIAGAQRLSSNAQPIPSGTITPVPVTVTANAAGAVLPAFAGLAYPKGKILGSLFTGADKSLIGMFKRLGPSLLRLGGTPVDQSVWTPNGPGGVQGHVSPKDIENLAAFIKATGWECLYAINLAGATTPALAVEEAAFVSEKLGPSLVSIELGNEPDFYGRHGQPFAGNWSLDQYVTLWTKYRNAIANRLPNLPISGPASGGNPFTWTIPFGQTAAGQNINMLTQHYYVADGQVAGSTVDNLLQTGLHRDLVRELAALQAQSQSMGIPFRMNECNSYFSNGGDPAPINIPATYTSALWGLDYMFMCAQAGAQGVNFEGGGNVPGYSPMLNDANSVTAVCPLYYAMLLFTLAGTGNVLETVVSPGALNVTAYALSKTTGGLSVVVLNKESDTNIQLQIELPQDVTKASLIELTQRSPGAAGPNLLATSGVTIQGAQVSTSGAFSPSAPYTLTPEINQVSCYVPALSAALIQLA
jgi:hypothetical protein